MSHKNHSDISNTIMCLTEMHLNDDSENQQFETYPEIKQTEEYLR